MEVFSFQIPRPLGSVLFTRISWSEIVVGIIWHLVVFSFSYIKPMKSTMCCIVSIMVGETFGMDDFFPICLLNLICF